MDSQSSVLYQKIQRAEISVEEAAREFEKIRAGYRRGVPERIIHASPSTENPNIAAVYRYDEPYLRDHQFNKRQVLLGVTYASLALDYGLGQVASGEALQLRELTFTAPILLAEGENVEVAIRATGREGHSFEAICRHAPSVPWKLAASGVLSAVSANSRHENLTDLLAKMTAVESLASIYEISDQIHIGDSYRTLIALHQRQNEGETLSRVSLAASRATESRCYRLHPLLINSAFLTIIPLLVGTELDNNFIPFGIKSLILHHNHVPETGWIHAKLSKNSGELVLFDAVLYDDDGTMIAEYNGCSLKRLRNDNLVGDDRQQKSADPISRDEIEDYLLALLQSIGASQIGKKQRHRNLMDLGLESVQLVNLARQIASAALIELEPTVFFEYPSIAELANFFGQAHRSAFTRLLTTPSETISVTPGIEKKAIVEPAAIVPSKSIIGNDRHQDIAIIGMQGQFGEAVDLDQFWQNIWQDRELIKEVPEDHWDLAPWFDTDPEAQDKTYSKWGSFIADVDKFDADFFHMSRREAQWMDPQVRLLLQSAYITAEHAGVIRQLRGSNTGVFIGSCFNEYLDKISELGLPMDPYIATGSGTIAANRISFWFDFKGPSLMFNTACSSSLVALHAACASLRNGECEMAFVGGSNLLLSSWHYRYFSTIRALSPTGRCHTFDARADGYVPGECVATLLLKPLSKALADGDPIHGVIKGSAALHGGYTPSLTAPSVAGEENVIVQAWQNAGIDPRSISYIEAHGTGTKLGDPIEINALKRAFARYTSDSGFCHIGSVKSNIGHTEGAAGIAGVLKVLQQMKHRKLPPLGRFKQQNPHIQFENSPLVINKEGSDWADQILPRRAGVSSFGFSGTNAHVVLEEYREQRQFAVHQGEMVLVPLSARNEQQLREQAARLLAHLARQTPDLAALAFTLQTGREPMATRAIFLVDSLAQLKLQLQAMIAGEPPVDFGRASMATEAALAIGDLRQLAALWLAGAEAEEGTEFDWEGLYGEKLRPARIDLPGYAFAMERHWLESPVPTVVAAPNTISIADTVVATYAEQWYEADEPKLGVCPKRLICLLGEPRLRQQLAREISSLSPETELVFVAASNTYERESDGSYLVPAQDPEQLRDSLRQVLVSCGECRVLYLWSMDDRRWITDSSAIVALLKAMAVTSIPIDRLLLAGRVGDTLERCYLESWIGIERSLGAVMKSCPVDVAIDISESSVDDSRWLRRVWLQLSGNALGSRLYQGDQTFRLMLIPTRPDATVEPLTLEQLHTMLITGGLGELGLSLAGELSLQAKRRTNSILTLILNGRSSLSVVKQARLDALRHEKCRIFYLQADCTDRKAMAVALPDVLRQSGPIDGVIHAAGLKAQGSLFESAQADFDVVLGAKVASTLVLDELLAEQPLALICYFSSSSAMLGDMGACSYAMANRFQQAYGRYVQTGRARRVVAINWPLWRDGGMAVGGQESTEFYLKSSGQRLLETTEGLTLLRQIVASNADQMLVLAGEAARLQKLVAGINRPEENGSVHASAKATAQNTVTNQSARLRNRPELKGLNLEQSVLWDLRDMASRPLKAERHTLAEDANLADFGFDSISLAEYATLLSRHFSLKLTPELFFSHATLAKLAAHLLSQHRHEVESCYRVEGIDTSAQLSKPTPVVASEPASDVDTIAIIGISGRFPGARNVDELWRLLVEGRDVVGEIPVDRYDWREFYGDHRDNPGKTRCIWMGSVPGIDEFDPMFFEISPREAKTLDPRQRLLLQESWNALEDAAVGPRHLETQRVGMFVGVEEGDFNRLAGDENLTSNHTGILASRLAYFLNLTGPTMAINTACSSALVALHQAASSLRNNECEMAIAAGVNLIFSPDAFIGMTQAGMLSPDGKCFTFDRRANGMVPGEAVCCVVLKPLARAEADGDRVYGVLRGSGINYDGKTNGITAPSGVSQQRLLVDVYQRAGIKSEAVEYIVTHGTGTQLGDPVEINALNDAFHGNTPGHCALTSTKTNFGHTFAASGLLSVISLLQAFQHETIPASLHCEQENNYIQWQESPFYVNKTNKSWPQADRDDERLGAVSAFGMSGTNAHVVLESYSRTHDVSLFQRPCYLLVLSAKTAAALKEKIEQLCNALGQDLYDDGQLPSISYTLLEGRHHFRHRLALVAADLDEARYSLRQYLKGEKRPNLFLGEVDREFSAQKTIGRYINQLLDDSCNDGEEETREVLSALADFYRQGYDIDGRRLFRATERGIHTAPQRLSLPGYPFAREHYWPENRQRHQQTGALTSVNSGSMHPLVHRNISTLAKQCFVSRFSGRETFLIDHRIGEHLIFPAVAYLECAREAIVRASELPPEQVTLQNVVWLRSLRFAVDSPSEIELFCDLMVSAKDSVSFKIYSVDRGVEQLHAQGDAQLAVTAAVPQKIDLSTLVGRCNLHERSHESLYSDFETMGVHYGATFRAASEIHIGRDLVIGKLFGHTLDPQLDGVLLQPGVLDSALHVAASLGATQQGAAEPALPFALERLQLHGSVEEALKVGPLTVIASYSSAQTGGTVEKIDVKICNAAGECLVELDGFSSRKTGVEKQSVKVDDLTTNEDALGRTIRTPYWKLLDNKGELQPAETKPKLFLLGLPEAVVEGVRQQFGNQVSTLPGMPGENDAVSYRIAASALFEQLQRLVRGNAGRHLQLYVGQGQDDLRLTALDAMLKTAMIENSELRARLVAVDPGMGDDAMIKVIGEQSRYHRNELIRIFASGSLYGRQWRELDVAPVLQNDGLAFRDGGTYAITGGAGGLGLIFADQIIESCSNPVLYLAGRSAITEQLQQKIARLQSLGATVHFHTLDVSNAAAVKQWVDRIYLEQGSLHGVIHSAGVIRDSMIIKKSVSEFEQVLAAKVVGIEALDQAINERAVDFVVCCSSQAAMGNLGQVDYAAANAYMDAYMHYRQNLAADGKRKGRSLSINWPLWRDGGMKLAPVIERQMRQQFGIVPMPVEDGMKSLRQLLTSSVSAQAWVIYGESSKLAGIGQSSSNKPQTSVPLCIVPEVGTTDISESELKKRIEAFVTRIVAEVTQIDAAKIHPSEKFEVYGFDSIMAVGVTNELEKNLGSLPKTLLFEHVNIAGMVDHFAVKYRDNFVAMFDNNTSKRTIASRAQETPAIRIDTDPVLAQALPRNRFDMDNRETSRATKGAASSAPLALAERVKDSELENYVAVIGLGGYYPGAANIGQLWQNLANGADSMSEFPAERWDHSKIYYKNRKVLGKTTCLNGAFIDDVDKFDYSYFKMPKVYADHMSPEVRLFLQVAVHTFEDAGYSKETLQSRYNGDVGVLLGTMTNDYQYYGFESNLFRGAIASGSGMATIPMTVSYFYGLTGPSLFIDTMCSSSSTCIHTACQMLKHDETKMVLAGGLNLMYHPYTTVNTSQGNFTSITSESVNSYGVGADGTVIGEGVGAVLLKRLDRAIADRDQIYGVIRGSAITNAGERNGFNVPNPDLQTLAIRQAMDMANVHPSTISYVEGHGSGTKLGDPIEVLGLNNAFRWATDDKQFCYLGSIKSNIGHLLAASGVAGLTKTLLQLKHRQIAPSIHSGELNQDIDFADTPFVVPQQLTEWRQPERIINGLKQVFPRRAGLTSIAAGGMNAHMIVEEYVEPADSAGGIEDDKLVFIFSVHKLTVLAENLTSFRDWLAQSEAPLTQIAYTLQVGKNNLRNRLVIRCRSKQDLLGALDACVGGHYDSGADSQIFYRFQENDAAQLPDHNTSDQLLALVTQWLSGDSKVDWINMYTQMPIRISLPVYRFEKTRCWYTEEDYESSILNPLTFKNKLHPLVAENCSTPQPGAMFHTDFVGAELLDYIFKKSGGQQFSAFNFVDVALGMPTLASQFDGRLLSVSCAFEHYIADWATVTDLEYRLFAIDSEQLELEFDFRRNDGQPVNLGFAVINQLTDDEPQIPQHVLDIATELFNREKLQFSHQLDAAEVSQKLTQAGYDFSPYLDDVGDMVIGRSALLLEGIPPVNRHNHYADNLQLSPYVATTIDKAFFLLFNELGLSQSRVIVRNIERLCSYMVPAGRFSVILSEIKMDGETLSLALLVFDEQAQICITADIVRLHLTDQELAQIKRDHHLLTGTVEDVNMPATTFDQQQLEQTIPHAIAKMAEDSAKPKCDDGESMLSKQILAFIQQELQNKLGFSASEIGESAQVHDLGLDSIMVVQLTDSVNKRFGTKLMPDLFYEKQQLGELVEKLEVA